MRKFFMIIIIPGIILGQEINPDEIVKNIDVKKEIEDWIEFNSVPIGFYKSYRYMEIYIAGSPFAPLPFPFGAGVLKPYFLEYLKKIKIENEEQIRNYFSLLWYIGQSTHIAIGEVLKLEVNIKHPDYSDTYRSRYHIKLIKPLRGKFKKDTILLWAFYTGLEEGVTILGTDEHQMWLRNDTIIFFMQKLPQSLSYGAKYGNDIDHVPEDFFPTGLICGGWTIKKINGEKRVLGCPGSNVNLSYEYVIDIIQTFVPVYERLVEEAKKYKFPLTEEEYAEFMKKRGYNYPLKNEDFQKMEEKFNKKWGIR